MNHHLHPDAAAPAKGSRIPVSSLKTPGPEDRLFPGEFPAALTRAIVSRHRRLQPAGSQEIIRFRNGYGAIISTPRRGEGNYEIAPLRFHGPGPEDYEFFFRSHVSDLTWCSEDGELVTICEQISKLPPPAVR